MIVVIFDNEKKAYEGSKVLKDLDAEDSITLYASAVIAKDAKERVAKAKGDAKAKLDARITEIQSDYKRRSDKLHQAWELTKEALA